jgi:hypothetical protein
MMYAPICYHSSKEDEKMQAIHNDFSTGIFSVKVLVAYALMM